MPRAATRSLAAVMVAGLGLVLGSASAALADIADVDYPSNVSGDAYIDRDNSAGQQFTSTLTGDLKRVDVYVNRFSAQATGTILNVAIYATTCTQAACKPAGTALGSGTAAPAALATVPVGAVVPNTVDPNTRPVSITFTSPIPITAGTTYSLVMSTPEINNLGGVWRWGTSAAAPNAFLGGNAGDPVNFIPGFYPWNAGLTLKTFLAGGDAPSSGSSNERFTVTLVSGSGSTATTLGETTVPAGWTLLPSSAPSSAQTLLGWSTSSAFPVERARDQLRRGWGAIDEVIDGTRMIFIPAGGSTDISAPVTLHAVWG